MTLYQKVLAVFSLLRNSIDGKADNAELAPAFSPTTEYSVGEKVMYGNGLYECTNAHYGPWDGRDFTRTSLSASIPIKMSDLTNDKGFVDAEALEAKFGDLSLADDATQADTRRMVQEILAALKDLATMTSLVFLSLILSLAVHGELPTDETNWEDVNPTNKVKSVVQEFAPPPDFSTNNPSLVQTILTVMPITDLSTNNIEFINTINNVIPKPDFSTNNEVLVNTIDSRLSTNNEVLVNTVTDVVDFSTNNTELVDTVTNYVDYSAGNSELVQTIRDTKASSKTVAMLEIPVNDIYDPAYTNEYGKTAWRDVEIVASTNNFTDILLHISVTNTVQGMGVSPLMHFPASNNARKIHNIWTYDADFKATMISENKIIHVVIWQTEGDPREWLKEDNDNLIFEWRRTSKLHEESYSGGAPVWRVCTPVRWFSSTPIWVSDQ